MVNLFINITPACSFGTFDNETTGEFTVTEDGMYLIEGSCYLKSNNDLTNYWQTSGTGMMGIGLLNIANNIFGGQYETTVESINKDVVISSSVLTYLTTSTKVRLAVLNLTDRSYSGNGYTGTDTIKFSITKIR